MKVFVAGATGVLGRSAVVELVKAGHDVTGIARTAEKADLLRSLGAAPVECDLFSRISTKDAVAGHDVVCNFATRIPGGVRYFLRRGWKESDRLHSEASSFLVNASLDAGVAHYLQHSVAFQYADGGDGWLGEDAPLDPPPHGLAILEAESQARRFTEAGRSGVSLRFGMFYGADAPNSRDFLRIAQLGFVPMPGRRDAYVSSVHVDDIGQAVVAALSAPAGEYNVVDDEPVTRESLASVFAMSLDRKKVRLQPTVFSRFGGASLRLIARSQRVSNRRFKSVAGWSPSVPSVQDGWPKTIAALRRRDD